MREQPASAARRFARDDGGATAVEYALIIGGIALAVGLVIWAIGPAIRIIFARVSIWFGG